MKKILKIYRVILLLLFVIMMAIGSIGLYYFYEFIQPMDYETISLGEITKPGRLSVTISSNISEPVGIVLISPSGREYTQSSYDISSEVSDSTRNLSILTADLGEWKARYRKTDGIKISISRSFKESNAAIIVNTKAIVDKNNKSTISINMTSKNYTYTMKAVRRNDGFSLTSSGDGGTTLNLEPYAYSGVWDFYLNTKRGNETYSTMFSYTFS